MICLGKNHDWLQFCFAAAIIVKIQPLLYACKQYIRLKYLPSFQKLPHFRVPREPLCKRYTVSKQRNYQPLIHLGGHIILKRPCGGWWPQRQWTNRCIPGFNLHFTGASEGSEFYPQNKFRMLHIIFKVWGQVWSGFHAPLTSEVPASMKERTQSCNKFPERHLNTFQKARCLS